MKHTRNRLLALALALTMTLSTLATGALAVQQTDQAASTAVTTMAVKTSGKCGKNVKWSYDKKTKTVTISGKGAMANYGGMNTYAPPWSDLDVRKAVIKKGVTTIGDKAFAHCENLQSVTIPEGVTSLGIEIFFDSSTKLGTITLPKSLKKVNRATFYGAYVSGYKVASGNKYQLHHPQVGEVHRTLRLQYGSHGHLQAEKDHRPHQRHQRQKRCLLQSLSLQGVLQRQGTQEPVQGAGQVCQHHHLLCEEVPVRLQGGEEGRGQRGEEQPVQRAGSIFQDLEGVSSPCLISITDNKEAGQSLCALTSFFRIMGTVI